MARSLKVVFRTDVRGIAQAGDVKLVSPGFARNYLYPRELAFEATPASLKQWETERQGALAHAARLREATQSVAVKIDAMAPVITAKVGQEGRLFGSVGRQEILDLLSKEGVQVEKSDILLESPIRQLGAVSVPIRLGTGVQAQLKINVIAEE